MATKKKASNVTKLKPKAATKGAPRTRSISITS